MVCQECEFGMWNSLRRHARHYLETFLYVSCIRSFRMILFSHTNTHSHTHSLTRSLTHSFARKHTLQPNTLTRSLTVLLGFVLLHDFHQMISTLSLCRHHNSVSAIILLAAFYRTKSSVNVKECGVYISC